MPPCFNPNIRKMEKKCKLVPSPSLIYEAQVKVKVHKHRYKHNYKHKPFTEALSLVSSVTAGKFETYDPLVAETKKGNPRWPNPR